MELLEIDYKTPSKPDNRLQVGLFTKINGKLKEINVEGYSRQPLSVETYQTTKEFIDFPRAIVPWPLVHAMGIIDNNNIKYVYFDSSCCVTPGDNLRVKVTIDTNGD